MRLLHQHHPFLFPTGQPGGKQAGPNSQGTEISSLVPTLVGKAKPQSCNWPAKRWLGDALPRNENGLP